MYKGKFIVILFFFNILLYPLNSKTAPNNDICVSQNISKRGGGQISVVAMKIEKPENIIATRENKGVEIAHPK